MLRAAVAGNYSNNRVHDSSSPDHTPNPPTKRQGSELIKLVVQNDPIERLASTTQLTYSPTTKTLVETAEVIPAGCVSAELGDALVSAARGEGDVDGAGAGVSAVTESFSTVVLNVLLFLVVPPATGGAIFGLMPLTSPADGMVGSGNLLTLIVYSPICFIGVGIMMLTALSISPSIKPIAVYVLAASFAFIGLWFVLAETWMYPVPLGFVIGVSLLLPPLKQTKYAHVSC
jgi:hypothetical protein